jgi:hypothetical protein
MALPGFTAEITLYKSAHHYVAIASPSRGTNSLVLPAFGWCTSTQHCCGNISVGGACSGICAESYEGCCDADTKCNWLAGETCCPWYDTYRCCPITSSCQFDPYSNMYLCLTTGGGGGGGGGGGDGGGGGEGGGDDNGEHND